MNENEPDVLKQILQVQSTLHEAGSMSRQALTALARHARGRQIWQSVETGCGATTLLLSYFSENHTVFALDIGGSITNVRRSPLLVEGVVSFVEGPSQLMLPKHHFNAKLQLVVIDGPHAYPFPDLEYYFLYPHLEPGSLLVLDDIHIRSINNLFEFLRRDEMFRLDEVVRNTAFFTRTDTMTFDPTGDGWRHQKYNARTLLRYDWRSALKDLFPPRLMRRLSNVMRSSQHEEKPCAVRILSPRHAEHVDRTGIVRGRATVPAGRHLWVLTHRKDVNGWWPQANGPVAVVNGSWTVQVNYGSPEDLEFDFEIAAVVVSQALHERWLEWVNHVESTGQFPPVQLPKAPHVLTECFRTVFRTEADARETRT